MMSNQKYKPRLCRIPCGANGYGFHLHGEKGKFGQVIRKIEPGTAASATNLRQGDRIVAVNGRNVENSSHQEVVARIKEKSDETVLLVVDKESDQYFLENKIKITEALALNDNVVEETVKEESLRPRLCHLIRGPQGFGFNLHSNKSRKGRFIRTVENDGPADVAGVLPGDRVIEVNGQNMEYDSHQNVVTAIKESGETVDLFLVAEASDSFFKSCRVTPTVDHLHGPLPTPLENQPDEVESPIEPPAAPASTPSSETPALSNGVDLMSIDLDSLKKMNRHDKKKKAPTSNWNNRQAMFNNL